MERNIFNNINMQDAKEFIDSTSSNYLEKMNESSRSFNSTWVKKFEEIFPYIDNIIRNPRRFIVPEEELTIVEKTKKVNEETVKHLAKHTSLIKNIDDDGFVQPSKLLNVYKEETFDLYENRFLNSLIKNLLIFMQKVMENDDFSSFSNMTKSAIYDGETEIEGEKVKIKLDVQLSEKKDTTTNPSDDKELVERIEYLKEVIYGWSSTDFIKSLSQAVPVKSPITKTNVFLKEVNFKKALELWEFLELFQDMDLTEIRDENKEDSSNKKKPDFDVIYYAAYNLITDKEPSKNYSPPGNTDGLIYKFIENYVMNSQGSEKDLQKLIQYQYKVVLNRVKRTDKEIVGLFRKIVLKYNRRKKKAIK